MIYSKQITSNKSKEKVILKNKSISSCKNLSQFDELISVLLSCQVNAGASDRQGVCL
jgi:hypothetical protein